MVMGTFTILLKTFGLTAGFDCSGCAAPFLICYLLFKASTCVSCVPTRRARFTEIGMVAGCQLLAAAGDACKGFAARQRQTSDAHAHSCGGVVPEGGQTDWRAKSFHRRGRSPGSLVIARRTFMCRMITCFAFVIDPGAVCALQTL